MALRASTPEPVARSITPAGDRYPLDALPEAGGDDPRSAARGIVFAALGGAAVWVALIGGAVAVVQRLH
jgi:hypothetical protein